MSKIVFFCIPAHGHTNPTLKVVEALCRRGHEVTYYSFEPFRAPIEAAGARFVGCDGYDVKGIQADGAEVARDIVAAAKLIASTTLSMEEQVTRELTALKPDVIVADSVAYWGKLFAQKLGIPLVISNTTFAFNRHSAKVMKQGFGDLVKTLVKMPRASRALKPLRERGYAAKGFLDVISVDDTTPTVVYTSRLFQPSADTFSDKFTFVGPCLRDSAAPWPKGSRPLIYVSMGTVIGGEGDFFRRCVEAFRDGSRDVVMSVGEGAEIGALPENIRAYPRVDQLSVLQSADVFITHCGMNSASEALCYGVPLLMRPLTQEEGGVANRVSELGAGIMLEDTSPKAIREAADALLNDDARRAAAGKIADSFHRCGGAEAAADAILAAIHA